MDLLLIRIPGHPFLFFITLLIILRVVFLNEHIRILSNNLISKCVASLPIISLIISITILLSYVFLVGWNVTSNSFNDDYEVNISAVSWLLRTGAPLYHELDSAERYSMLYGPMLYLIEGFFLDLIGPSIFSAKIGGALAGIFSIISLFLILQKASRYYRIAVVYSAYTVLIFLAYGTVTFRARADSLILACVSLGLLCVISGRPIIATMLAAITLGISINLKIHSIFYFLPIYALLYSQFKSRYFSVSVLGAITIAVIPFLTSSQISAGNYISWLGEAAKHGLDIRMLMRNVEWTLYLLAPVLILLSLYWHHVEDIINQNKLYLLSMLISIIIIDVVASKAGSGPYHLVPLIPLFTYLAVLILDKGKDTFCVLDKERYYSRTIISAILALLMTIFTIAGLSQYYNNVKVVNRIYSSDVVSDIRKLMRSYPDSTIGMGYGGDVSLTYYRPVLVFAGNPYFVDSAALTDMQFSSHGLSSKTLDALNSCRIKIWLIPKNGKPFEIDNYYQSSKPLFSAQFKTIFSERYELRDQTKYFDVWFCKSLDFVH